MNSAKKELLKDIMIAEQMKKEFEKRRKNIIKGKLKYLVEENSRDKECALNAREVEELIAEIHRLGKSNCIIQERCENTKSIISMINLGEYLLLDQSFENGENKMCVMEKEYIRDAKGIKIPNGEIKINELFEKKKKYTLQEFLRDSTRASMPGILPVEFAQAIRPMVVCADGFELSIQASMGHYCEPAANGRYDYKKLEIGKVSERVEELDKYMEPGSDEVNYKKAIFGYVPKELVERILDAHGGIDKQKTFGGRDEVAR